MAVYFERIESEVLSHYSYMIGGEGRALVIDPRRDCDIYMAKAQEQGLRITDVLETHRHEDFLVGSKVLGGLTGALVWHADGQLDYRYGESVNDGQTWEVAGHVLQAIATPGHTLGSFSYVLRESGTEPWMLFCGDVLFPGDVGRVDLMGSERMAEMAGLLHDSLFGRLLPLGDGVLVFPAHGAGSVCGGSTIADRELTTIGVERRLNPRLQLQERSRFVEAVAAALERPPYFTRMEEMNLVGAEPVPAQPPALTADEFESQASGADVVVLDTRNMLEFNAAHLPGSLFIWQEALSKYAGWFLPHVRPVLLVAGDQAAAGTIRQLQRIGYDNVRGWLSGGLLAWNAAVKEALSTEVVSAQELCRLIRSGGDICVLDVRSGEELEEEGGIPGATSVHITLLAAHLSDVPECGRLYIFCGTGRRSTIAASLLARDGYPRPISVVAGGMEGWMAASCQPTRK